MNPESKDRSMGGRFGKYGNIKRKTRLQRSRSLKKDIYRLKYKSIKLKKGKKITPQSMGKLNVDVEFKL